MRVIPNLPLVADVNPNAASALEVARSAGIDLDMIDSNLSLSVKERWTQHEQAFELAMKLKQAGEVRYAKLQSIANATK